MKALVSRRRRFNFSSLAAAAIAACALSACATSDPIGRPVPVAVGQEMRASLATADRLVVYEGLPHQTKEVELLERELARRDVTRIHGYPFYTPAVPARQQAALRQILGDVRTYGVYTGPKTCGGFHPDFAIHWRSGGIHRHILICYGCGEALFSDGGRLMPFDIRHAQLNEIRRLLASHVRKRPTAGD